MSTSQGARVETFNLLKSLLLPFSEQMICTLDEAQEYSLNTSNIIKNKKSLFFAAVKMNKQYVSFHLMPVYVFPDLLTQVSPDLRQRMHGKSCFNFRTPEQVPQQQLASLVQSAVTRFESAGYISDT